jgi:hypothetical protein
MVARAYVGASGNHVLVNVSFDRLRSVVTLARSAHSPV